MSNDLQFLKSLENNCIIQLRTIQKQIRAIEATEIKESPLSDEEIRHIREKALRSINKKSRTANTAHS
jgi:hypothetical protein